MKIENMEQLAKFRAEGREILYKTDNGGSQPFDEMEYYLEVESRIEDGRLSVKPKTIELYEYVTGINGEGRDSAWGWSDNSKKNVDYTGRTATATINEDKP